MRNQALRTLGIHALASLPLLFWTGFAAADQTVNAAQVVVVSDDISNETTNVVHAGDTPSDSSSSSSTASSSGNSSNRSGLGDGTNPGKGGGRANSRNQGTDNPSQAKRK
jgi:hypothetical protein